MVSTKEIAGTRMDTVQFYAKLQKLANKNILTYLEMQQIINTSTVLKSISLKVRLN
jgi:hypothetical protein